MAFHFIFCAHLFLSFVFTIHSNVIFPYKSFSNSKLDEVYVPNLISGFNNTKKIVDSLIDGQLVAFLSIQLDPNEYFAHSPIFLHIILYDLSNSIQIKLNEFINIQESGYNDYILNSKLLSVNPLILFTNYRILI